MNAFMGLFTWAALLSPEPLQFEDIIFIGNGTSLQIYANARSNSRIARETAESPRERKAEKEKEREIKETRGDQRAIARLR